MPETEFPGKVSSGASPVYAPVGVGSEAVAASRKVLSVVVRNCVLQLRSMSCQLHRSLSRSDQ
jgi:hypothetical protein